MKPKGCCMHPIPPARRQGPSSRLETSPPPCKNPAPRAALRPRKELQLISRISETPNASPGLTSQDLLPAAGTFPTPSNSPPTPPHPPPPSPVPTTPTSTIPPCASRDERRRSIPPRCPQPRLCPPPLHLLPRRACQEWCNCCKGELRLPHAAARLPHAEMQYCCNKDPSKSSCTAQSSPARRRIPSPLLSPERAKVARYVPARPHPALIASTVSPASLSHNRTLLHIKPFTNHKA